jgi:hypothetical protein
VGSSSGLVPVNGTGVSVLASPGTEERAADVGRRVADARLWLSDLIGVEPRTRVFAVGPRDWPRVTDFPVFGFPHIVEDDAIVVGSEPSPFFDELVAMLRPQLSETDRNDLDNVYGEPADVSRFSDLLAVHELGHVFHVQSGFWFPRRWLTELFANIALEGWVREREPTSLPALHTFPRCFATIDHSGFAVTALDRMEHALDAGPAGPVIYAWYQCVLHCAAARVWDAAGSEVFRDLHTRFRGTPPATDLGTVLVTDIHPVFGEVIRAWPHGVLGLDDSSR